VSEQILISKSAFVPAAATSGVWRAITMKPALDTQPRVHEDTHPGSALTLAPDTSVAAQMIQLFHTAPDLLATISPEGRFVLLNPAWEDVLGFTREQLLAQPMSELVHPDDIEQTMAVMLTGSGGEAELVNFTNRYRHKDGSWRWLLWSARSDGSHWYASAKDVTDRMWLERQALHDPLTKLPNRLLLMDRARQALARLHRTRGLVALSFVDLDRFKAVNDNLGHALGDRLLVSVAERLATMMRDSDTVARLGGDEFVILAEDLQSDTEAVSVAERVLHALEEPFVVGSAEVSMLASVGVSVSHDPYADPETLLREADVAMYRAKRAGGYGLELFDEQLRREVRTHLDIESRLREALPRSELSLAYQPIVPLDGDSTIGCEALLRWDPADGERVEPSEFLPLAEESDLIAEIGEWVLNNACAQAAAWRSAGEEVAVSVNISARGLSELDIAGRVEAALTRHKLPPDSLWVEITEAAVLRDRERAQTALNDIKVLQVKLALDGFGSGQTQLTLAGSLPLDVIKIDRALIQSLPASQEARSVVLALVALARARGIATVAVGIETDTQLQLARELGCSLGQGFLLHPPESAQRLSLRGPGAVRSPAPWGPFARLRHRL
jgi:diguanylate cyclase (GGDEF)-like protein/PAS domain S-box-containing protein